MNALLPLLGIDVPIIQAPMAGVSTPEMAAAVCEAGAIGSIAIGAVAVAAARDMIHAVRARTARPFNVNVFCHRPPVADPARERAWIAHLTPEFTRHGATPPAQLRSIDKTFIEDDAMLAMLLSERPTIVSVYFGLPTTEQIAALHAVGVTVITTATHPAEARAGVLGPELDYLCSQEGDLCFDRKVVHF